MSVKISGKVWELELEPMDKLVALALAEYADHEGNNARPGNELLMAMTGLSQQTISAKITKLIQLGLLEPVSDVTGRGNRREFTVDPSQVQRRSYFAEKEQRKLQARRTFQPKESYRQGVPFEPGKGTSTAHLSAEKGTSCQEERYKLTGQKVQADSIKVQFDESAYKEHEPLEPSIEPSIEPSERDVARVPSIIGLLADAYKNIATTQRDETTLMQQAAEIEGAAATVEQVQNWLAYRHTLPTINFIAREFKTWRANQQRQAERGTVANGQQQQPRFQSAAERSTQRLAERDYDAIALAAAGNKGLVAAD